MSKRTEDAAFAVLQANGMHPDRDLLKLIDLSSIVDRGETIAVPADFAARIKQAKPFLFAKKPLLDIRHLSDSDYASAKADALTRASKEQERRVSKRREELPTDVSKLSDEEYLQAKRLLH